MSLPLLGRRALVTGASRGLGAEIARQLAAAGAHLALLGRDRETLDAAAAAVRAARADESQTLRSYVADLTDDRALQSVATTLLESGGVDVLINNAAIQGPIGPFEETNWEAWQSVFQVNFLAPALLCRLLIPAMRRHGWGKIVNLSGGGATGPRPDLSAYGAAKCALVRLSETLAAELRGSGIDINCVAPGAMNTRMLEELLAAGPDGARAEYARAKQQAQSGGMPLDQAARLVTWLASPVSDGISGRLLSAVWDAWADLPAHLAELNQSDVYTLRRIVPSDRGFSW
jgi:3-oxoacyl-[acyl-carrier protein] reductase